jgi:hypothetical protein
MQTHSCVLAPQLKATLSSGVTNKYGRMFPDLPGLACDEMELLALGAANSSIDAVIQDGTDESAADNPRIPAGFAVFGQVIAHDITADRSLLQHHANVDALQNVRTPRFDLELLYGMGPTGSPYLYDATDTDKFLLGPSGTDRPFDVPRNQQGTALIGDPRDDVYLIIAQLHFALLSFHNHVVDLVRETGTPVSDVFEEARQLVRWHYQWVVVHEFLSLTVGEALMEQLREHGPVFYDPMTRPFIPVEFADAAYRFGHSQIRATYRLNDHVAGSIFPDLAGGRAVPPDHVVDWRDFFAIDPSHPPQASRKIAPQLVHPLIDLPRAIVGDTDIPEHHSLASRDLQRSRALDLPSGETVARAMGLEPLDADGIGLKALGWQDETPLWLYILKEAEVQTNGERLGDVGGRIVAEVLLGLLDGDAQSYRQADPGWTPTLPSTEQGAFTMADLLRTAEMV